LAYFSNFLYLLLFVPAAMIIEKIGMKWSLLIACFFSIGGSWVSLLGE
jgi:hypothetical protein